MADDYPHEPGHVGRLLAGHRDMLGISRPELARSLGHRGLAVAHRIENDPAPTYAEIEDHHTALIETYNAQPGAKAASVARREQWWATAADIALWQAASEQHPSVSWWWGVRSATGERGAYCNLCRETIHGYDTGRGVTRRTRMAVMTHRFAHITSLTEHHTPYLKEATP